MNQMGVTMIPDSADFRLMSNRAVHVLLKYSERNLFLRGLVPQLGFQAGKVYYQRTARLAGETKYPFKKMVGFGAQWNYVINQRTIATDFWARNDNLSFVSWAVPSAHSFRLSIMPGRHI